MLSQNPLFIFFGNGPFENRGCDAILQSTIEILKKEFGSCRFINSLSFPSEISYTDTLGPEVVNLVPEAKQKIRRWPHEWLEHQFRKRILRRPKESFEPYLSEAKAALALGGDNYSLDYGSVKRYFQANSTVLSSKIPLILWGASVGPFSRNPEIEKYAAKELKKVSLICARESETVNYLASLGIEDNVRQVADPAFTLRSTAIENLPPELKIIEQPCIGMNFSPLMKRYWNRNQSWENFVITCIKKTLKKFDLPIILIPHVVWTGQDDHLFMKRLAESLDTSKNKVLLVDRSYNARQLKWIISKMKLFLGCRTHATIASLSSEVPTLSIGYSVKAKGINKDIFGHTDWLIPLDDITPDLLIEKLKTILNAQKDSKNHLGKVIPSYKKKAFAGGQYLKELLC